MAKRGALEHPKTLALADALGIMDCFALGIMEAFWHHVAKYHDDGDITTLKPSVCARSIRYTGDAAQLFSAMEEVGLLERLNGRLIVHGWSEHADDAIHARLFRAIRRFSDGSKPLPRSIGKEERARLDNLWTSAGQLPDVLPEPEPEPEPEPVTPPNPLARGKAILLPEDLATVSGLQEAWDEWERDRKARHKPLTDKARQLQWAKLREFPDKIAAIHRAIERGHQSFFPDNPPRAPNPKLGPVPIADRRAEIAAQRQAKPTTEILNAS